MLFVMFGLIIVGGMFILFGIRYTGAAASTHVTQVGSRIFHVRHSPGTPGVADPKLRRQGWVLNIIGIILCIGALVVGFPQFSSVDPSRGGMAPAARPAPGQAYLQPLAGAKLAEYQHRETVVMNDGPQKLFAYLGTLDGSEMSSEAATGAGAMFGFVSIDSQTILRVGASAAGRLKEWPSLSKKIESAHTLSSTDSCFFVEVFPVSVGSNIPVVRNGGERSILCYGDLRRSPKIFSSQSGDLHSAQTFAAEYQQLMREQLRGTPLPLAPA